MKTTGKLALISILISVSFTGCSDLRAPRGMHDSHIGAALAQFNRGAALLEQYRYAEAAKTFEKVLQKAPDWTAARFNMGLAYLNMQEERGAQQHLSSAKTAFETILQVEPDHLHARFSLGLYHQHVGGNTEALRQFDRVYQADSNDPYVGYKYAETLIAAGQAVKAVEVLQKVIQEDPGFVSGFYRLAMQYQRTGHRDKALKLLERFKELKNSELTGGSFTVLKAYGSAGKFYMALGPDNLPVSRAHELTRILFSPDIVRLDTRIEAWATPSASVAISGLASSDVDGDGDLDLCLTAAGEGGSASIWLNDGHGNFTRGFGLPGKTVSPCFGDIDNDGNTDLWLGRAGRDMYFTGDGKGGFKRIDAEVSGGEFLTPWARLADVDSDGDLDLLAFRLSRGMVPAVDSFEAATASVYNNNRDGSFTDLAKRLGLQLQSQAQIAAVYDDFDGDRDLDFVIFSAEGRGAVGWVNDRVWQHHLISPQVSGLKVRKVLAATSGDPDSDGDRDLLVFSQEGLKLFLNDGSFRFREDDDFINRHGHVRASGGQFADMDNDGDLDIVVGDAVSRGNRRGPLVLINDLPANGFIDATAVDAGCLLGGIQFEHRASCVVADFTGNGACDIFLAPTGEQPLLIRNITSKNHWLEIDLRGTRPRDKKSRSNNSAVGARVEIKTGTISQQHVVGIQSGPTAMPPYRIHAGLGPYAKVDWLRITWPDAVLQAELEVPGDRVMTITEIQRKTSSCPHLFAWNGSHFEFVSDFGGMGGIGYLVQPGVYAKPDPTEYVSVPNLEPYKDHYVLQVVEPIEEIAYFDEAKLLAVDHPVDTEVYPNEMMAVGVDPPPFELFVIKNKIDPVSAIDHRGTDVRERVMHIDRSYAGATRPNPRFIGLAEDHFVELDFGDQLSELSSKNRIVLFLYGWVEYGYSSTNFAASQARMRTKVPSIYVLRDGNWVELFHEVGYPAGIRHMMTLDVTGKILPGDRRIRIESNMDLYWDRIFLAPLMSDPDTEVTETAAVSADLHFLGYPREYSPDGGHPTLYDYHSIDGAVAWKIMPGRYTRFGDVTELVNEADDCFVIMGRGEELTLLFPSDVFGFIPEGYQRSFILKTDSYCKDMDLYCAYPDTVEPLPFHAMSNYPYGPDEKYPDDEKHRLYRQKYNTRIVGQPPNKHQSAASRE